MLTTRKKQLCIAHPSCWEYESTHNGPIMWKARHVVTSSIYFQRWVPVLRKGLRWDIIIMKASPDRWSWGFCHWPNAIFNKNIHHYSSNETDLITTKCRIYQDSTAVVPCAKFLCDRSDTSENIGKYILIDFKNLSLVGWVPGVLSNQMHPQTYVLICRSFFRRPFSAISAGFLRLSGVSWSLLLGLVLQGSSYYYISMTSYWVRWRLKAPASPLFAQGLVQTQIKGNIKAPRHWPLCGEFTGHRWIPRTKGQ